LFDVSLQVNQMKSQKEVPVKDWVTEATLDQQNRIIAFLLVFYGFLLIATVTIFFLQGFRAWGFVLDRSLLMWLGGATIGEIGGLLMLTFKTVFGQGGKTLKRSQAKSEGQ
jgi:hypothetical protein